MASKPPANTSSSSSSAPSLPPNQTLYLQNLNDKIRKPDLRTELYTLFSTYGVVLDVNALKTMKGRGQAHITFRDVAAATQAMRALQGFEFFGKEMRISYAKGKSHAIAKLDGTYNLVAAGAGVKRQRDEESDEGEEMDVEDDDD
ncbi:RNA-binding domain-containing protein [Choiromyces venosus 120613-1]|uniref:RNA-binding domain-containing protein n=1 Tax=Choiromyces venosus 120613-1 TaxID=1336337 RepID=A0A3N4J2Z7_9PEZI|nr:RNA-binding domain-containing protein [Choiromyces venosus 120613-1]